jgi:hypothetical protein
MGHFDYPHPPPDHSVIDNLHGDLVPDPYRYFEDPEDSRTTQFVEDSDKVFVYPTPRLDFWLIVDLAGRQELLK